MSSASMAILSGNSCDSCINDEQDHQAVTGAWRLPSGQALSLWPQRPALLRVRHGRVWATLGVAGVRVPGELGDHFLDAGDCLHVPAGARLVLEAMAPPGEAAMAAQFDWTEAAQAHVPLEATRFERDVLMPWRELGAASGQAARAVGRLLCGLLAHGEQRVLAWWRERLGPGCR